MAVLFHGLDFLRHCKSKFGKERFCTLLIMRQIFVKITLKHFTAQCVSSFVFFNVCAEPGSVFSFNGSLSPSAGGLS